MNILLNGQEKDIKPDTTLERLISELEKDPKTVLASVNGNIVMPDTYKKEPILENSKIDLMSFVGGG